MTPFVHWEVPDSLFFVSPGRGIHRWAGKKGSALLQSHTLV